MSHMSVTTFEAGTTVTPEDHPDAEVGTITAVRELGDDQLQITYETTEGGPGTFLSWNTQKFHKDMVVVVTAETDGDMPQSFKGR